MRIIRKTVRSFSVACAIAGLMAGLPQAAAAADVSFAGKTIDIMVNFAAGGGTDTAARLVAPYVAKHLPGNPKVIVTNKAGAGGTAAIDYLMNSVPPNGLHIGYFSGTPLRWALDLEQVPEGTGDLPFVAARSVNQIFMVRKDENLSFATFPGYAKPLYMAINSPDNHVAIRTRLLTDTIGVKDFNIVSGYKGQGKMVAAVRSGEASMSQANDTFFGANHDALLGDGLLTTLGQMGVYHDGKIVAQKGLEDIPVFDQLWRKVAPDTLDTPAYKAWEGLHIAMAVQNSFVLPPKTPEDYYSVWSDAVLAAYNDPEYIAKLNETGIPVPSTMGLEDVRKAMSSLQTYFSDPEIKKVIKAAIDRNTQ
jgi:tripartite-type tricarboxylate transporter receptor subunit TctC